MAYKGAVVKLTNIANFKTVEAYVKYKADRLKTGEQSFCALFELMFSEKENTFWESNDGYRIIKKSYGEVKDEILKKAFTLENMLLNEEKGSVIGLYMQNSVEWIETFWVILKCGYRPLLLNTRLEKSIIEEVIKSVDARAVISDGECFSVKTIDQSQIACAENTCENTDFGEEILLMSSGTSNAVKACGYDAKAIISQILNAEQIVKKSRLIKKHYEGELKLLTFLPFYHIFGLTATYMWFAFFSRTLVHLKDMSSQCILNTIRRHKITHIFAVPLFWNTVYGQAIKKVRERGEKTCLKLQKGLKISEKLSIFPHLAKFFRKRAFKEVRDKMFGESVCFMITGGGCISREVLSFFNGIGYHLSNGYGMTEIGITSVELSENGKVLNSGSVGEPMTSVEYKINEGGELLVRGNSLCKYYIENGRKIQMDGDWFNTKALAVERNSRFFLTGRLDDLIISSSGENINPNLYENEFNIRHAKRVCIIDAKKGGQAYPVILVSAVKYLSHETRGRLVCEVKERLKELNLLSEIKEVVLVGEDLIKGNEFKLNRKRLAEEYLSGRLNILSLSEQEGEASLDGIERQVAMCFERALGKAVAKSEDFFVELGGTSLEYFTLINYIQEEFDLTVPLSSDKRLITVNDFSEYIKENM